MPWPKPDPKDVLGFDPAEIGTMKTKLDSINIDDINATKAAAESANAGITALRGELQQLGQNLRAPAPNKEEEPAPVIDWETDPKTAANAAIAPIAGLVVDTRVRMEMDQMSRAQVRNKDTGRLEPKYPFWNEYVEDIEKLINQQPLAHRMNRSVLENCYKAVVADHLDEITANRTKRGQNYHLESSSNQGVNAPVVDNNQPTELDIKMAAKFKMTPEQYMKSRKQLQYVGV